MDASILKAADFKRYAREQGWRVRSAPFPYMIVCTRYAEEVRVGWLWGRWFAGFYFIKGGLIKRVRSAAEARQILFEKPARNVRRPRRLRALASR